MGKEAIWPPSRSNARAVYIGWTSSVSTSYTDQATAYLLEHLIAEKQTVKQAVGSTTRAL